MKQSAFTFIKKAMLLSVSFPHKGFKVFSFCLFPPHRDLDLLEASF